MYAGRTDDVSCCSVMTRLRRRRVSSKHCCAVHQLSQYIGSRVDKRMYQSHSVKPSDTPLTIKTHTACLGANHVAGWNSQTRSHYGIARQQHNLWL
jgi:hypothetical protein